MSNPYEPPLNDSPAALEAPTRARLGVLGFLCSMAFILYLDRVCMSKAVVPIQQELQLSSSQMGWILSAFTLAYGLFEIPTGRWGDRFGSRRILTRIVLWWSVFTMLTAASPWIAQWLFRGSEELQLAGLVESLGLTLSAVTFQFGTLVLIRFLFGAGEAGAFPNTARIIARWFPTRERGRVQGLILTASLIGGTLAPIVAAYLIRDLGWRAAFVVFGTLGVAWALAFYHWFRDDPAEHASTNDAECRWIAADGPAPAQHHEPIPWRAVFRNRSIWFLGGIVTCGSFNSYLYFSWYATYLEKGRAVESVDAGWLAGLALGGAAVGQLGGGFVVDWVLRHAQRPVRARRILGCFSYGLAALLLAISVNCDSAALSAVMAGASCCAMFIQQSSWWSSAIEVSGKHVGSLFGLMNGLGIFGAMSSQVFFGHFAEWRAAQGFHGRDQWDPAFLVVVGVLIVGAVAWLFVDPSRHVDEQA